MIYAEYFNKWHHMIPITIKENKLNPDTSVAHVYLHHGIGDH